MGIISDFMGKTAQRKADEAYAESERLAQQALAGQRSEYEQAENYFRPYAEGGQRGQRFYDEALGLYGDEARGAATSSLASNPLFQGQLGQESNAISRVLNAQGNSGGGKAHLAAQRVFQGSAGNWLDRYANRGQQGMQASNAMAGYRAKRGDLAYGYGATRAGNAIQYGNAQAANRNTPWNNAMALGGLGVNALNAYNQPKLK
jgi:hypothetical protein